MRNVPEWWPLANGITWLGLVRGNPASGRAARLCCCLRFFSCRYLSVLVVRGGGFDEVVESSGSLRRTVRCPNKCFCYRRARVNFDQNIFMSTFDFVPWRKGTSQNVYHAMRVHAMHCILSLCVDFQHSGFLSQLVAGMLWSQIP